MNEKNIFIKEGITMEEDVVLLGEKYKKSLNGKKTELFKLIADFESILWFTYRKDFPPISGKTIFRIKYSITTDRGWGCMMRTGQMMLGNAICRFYLGRKWRIPKIRVFTNAKKQMTVVKEGNYPKEYKRIISMFYDDPKNHYSIHSIVKMGEKIGKRAGEWFGPCTISNVLSTLVNQKEESLVFYKAKDGCVDLEELRKLCFEKKESKNEGHTIECKESFKPIIIMIPTRLGIEKINPNYLKNLQCCLGNPYTIGIIGGRPSHSLYFVGYQKDSFIYLDPHTTKKPTLNPQEYHCKTIHHLQFKYLDPSMAFGFFCANAKELDSLIKFLEEISGGDFPICFLQKERSNFEKLEEKITTF